LIVLQSVLSVDFIRATKPFGAVLERNQAVWWAWIAFYLFLFALFFFLCFPPCPLFLRLVKATEHDNPLKDSVTKHDLKVCKFLLNPYKPTVFECTVSVSKVWILLFKTWHFQWSARAPRLKKIVPYPSMTGWTSHGIARFARKRHEKFPAKECYRVL
jgi:hypothetical protein